MLGQVGLSQEDEDGLYACCHCLLDACSGGLILDFSIYRIIDKESLRRGYWIAIVVKDIDPLGASLSCVLSTESMRRTDAKSVAMRCCV